MVERSRFHTFAARLLPGKTRGKVWEVGLLVHRRPDGQRWSADARTSRAVTLRATLIANGYTCIGVKRLLVSLVCSLLVGGCAWTDSGDSDRASEARPVARLIAYTKYLPGGKAEIWVARVDGSGKRRLAEGRSPAISPDGRWVVFEGGREAVFEPRFYRDLLLGATAGGRPRLLVRGARRPVCRLIRSGSLRSKTSTTGGAHCSASRSRPGRLRRSRAGRSTTSASRPAATRSPTPAARCSGMWTSTLLMPTGAASAASPRTSRARTRSGGRARSPSPASSPTAAGAHTKSGLCGPTAAGAGCWQRRRARCSDRGSSD